MIVAKNVSVLDLQKRLNAHGFNLKEDGAWGSKTENAVLEFQKKNALYADGVVGNITWKYLLEEPNKFKDVYPKLKFVEIKCDVWKSGSESGYNKTIIREDCSESFQKACDEVRNFGSIITSSGGRRWLNSSAGSNRSKVSFHYIAKAHDFFVRSMGVDPHKDPYIMEKSENGRFIIWARGKEDLGAQHKELNAFTYKHEIIKVSGFFINMTEIFQKYGWQPISPRKTFWTRKDWLAAEPWHLQQTDDLIVGKSTFGEELLKSYSLKELEKYDLWNYKTATFGVNWF